MSERPRSHELYRRACELMPAGVDSPVRAFRGVGGDPVFFKSSKGAYITDEDGKSYVDYVGSWGPMIVGHSHPEVIKAVQDVVANGLGFGAPTAIQTIMTDKVC